jgi:hypothetical protein
VQARGQSISVSHLAPNVRPECNKNTLIIYTTAILPWCRQSRRWRSNLRKPEQRVQSPLELRQVRNPRVRAPHTWGPFVNRRQRRPAYLELRKLVVRKLDSVSRIPVARRDCLFRLQSALMSRPSRKGDMKKRTLAMTALSGLSSTNRRANLAALAVFLALVATCTPLRRAMIRC